LHGAKFRGYSGVGIAGRVDQHRQKERGALGSPGRALCGEFPFEPEITFQPLWRSRRDDRAEQRTRSDRPANLRIPRIAPDERGLIEPDLDARRAQRRAETQGGRRVLRRGAEEDRAARRGTFNV
jgi:hypothetical protein